MSETPILQFAEQNSQATATPVRYEHPRTGEQYRIPGVSEAREAVASTYVDADQSQLADVVNLGEHNVVEQEVNPQQPEIRHPLEFAVRNMEHHELVGAARGLTTAVTGLRAAA